MFLSKHEFIQSKVNRKCKICLHKAAFQMALEQFLKDSPDGDFSDSWERQYEDFAKHEVLRKDFL